MIRHIILSFCGSRNGATAVEYALLLGLLVLAIVGGITAVGNGTSNNFDAAANGFPSE